MGYLIRLTELNNYPTPSWIGQMGGFGFASLYTACSFVFKRHADMSLFAELTGVCESQLTSMMYPPANGENSYRQLIFDLPLPQYMIRLNKAKICPDCLRESNYCRRIWDLSPVTVCPYHRCLLLDECPNCKKKISWIRSKVSVCSCEFCWQDINPARVTNAELRITQQIYKLCRLNFDSPENNSTHNPLLGLELEYLVSALFFIAGQYEGIIDTKGKFLAPSRRNREIHSLINKAFTIFEDWPNNYYAFLDWRRIHMSNSRYVGGLRKDFGEYKYALYDQFAATQFDFMRLAFEEFLTKQWSGGYATSIKRLKANPLGERKYISHAEAREQLKTDYKQIDQLIDNGKLKAVVNNQGKQRLVLIEVSSVEEYKHELEDLLGLKEVATLLGTNVQQVLDLSRHNCLNPVRGPTIDGYKFWKFSYKQVRDLLHKVEESTATKCYMTEDAINLRMALSTLSRCKGLGMAKFVKAILDGEICPYGKNRKTGLHAFVFSKKHVLSYLRDQHRGKNKELLSVPEVAERLKLDLNTIYFLVGKELIPAQKSTGNEWSVLTVTKANLNIFTSSYVFITEIVNSLRTTPRRLIHLLKEKNISPVSGPTIDGGKKYLFRKSDLESVDLDAMLAQARAESRETKLLKIRLHHEKQRLARSRLPML